jgi:hypothetical protein
VWIQAEHNENYFGVHVVNQAGKILRRGSELVYHRSGQDFRTNPNAAIAKSFFGYIYGAQYYRELQSSKEP